MKFYPGDTTPNGAYRLIAHGSPNLAAVWSFSDSKLSLSDSNSNSGKQAIGKMMTQGAPRSARSYYVEVADPSPRTSKVQVEYF